MHALEDEEEGEADPLRDALAHRMEGYFFLRELARTSRGWAQLADRVSDRPGAAALRRFALRCRLAAVPWSTSEGWAGSGWGGGRGVA